VLLVSCLLAGGLLAGRADPPAPPPAVARTVRAYFTYAGGLAAGLSVEVSRGSKVLWAGGFGTADVAKRVPATARTVYQIGSITKTFTAALVMQLVQQHRLKLSDPLAQFVPGLPWGNRVTIAELLDHTSGIVDYLNSTPSMLGAHCRVPSGAVAGCPRLRPDHVVGWLADHALQFQPGTEWSYSNSNYYLLGLVIERVTGQPYGSYLEDHVLAPLGLSHTGACPDDMRPPSDAVGYLVADQAGSSPVPVRGADPIPSDAFSAGELCSTTGDLVEWANDLASGRVVRPGTYKEMATPTRLPDGKAVPYGYGLQLGPVDGQPSVSHHGSIFGFVAFVYHLPHQDLNIAVCFNSQGQHDSAGLYDDVLFSVTDAIVQTVLNGTGS
jgi:CubicO group peptidase (beta-lactamase class C family)